MADKTIWRGQSINLTIGQIQDATKPHISKYVFYSDTTDLGGLSQLDTASTTVLARASVNASKDYTITSYLLYSHNFAESNTTVATSNRVDNVLTVREPLDATSLTNITPNNAGDYHNWVWSNTPSATFAIIPTFASNQPWSKRGIITSDSTNPAAPKGYTNTLKSEDISTNNGLTWSKTTGSTTDLGEASQNITVYVKSTTYSAPTAKRIEDKNATFVVRNAVTGLSGLTSKQLFAGSTAVTETVLITPNNPYSKDLILVGKDEQDVNGTSITSDGKATVSLSDQTITLDASKVTPGTATQTIKFKVRSRQSNAAVDTGFITFTVNRVDNIDRQSVVEGQTISVSPGIGAIHTAKIDSGDTAISISPSGETLSITGLGVDDNTDWSITVTNDAGAHITISGTTTILEDVSRSINTGDYIIIGTDTLTGLGESISTIVTKPTAGTASITSDGKLKYEASTANGPITEGTYAIKVKGANGATRTVNVVVSYINTTPSETDYLCFTSTGDSTVAMKQTGTPSTSANKVIQYKLNDGQWQNWDLSAVSLTDGDKMYLKSDDEIPISESDEIYKQFKMDGDGYIAASGNIMSLLNFSTILTAYAFNKLFDSCSSLTTAPALPATTLANYCYNRMFAGCYSLTTAPDELPATTLAKNCYDTMFASCRLLTTAPALPATTLADYCYSSMFSICTSLTTAPELPATTLAKSCYQEMFNQCKSLTTAPELPATTLAPWCYSNMFAGHIINGYVPFTQAPELPATILAEGCYYNMFKCCKNLNYVKAMFTDISARTCLNNWLSDVSETGKIVKNASATWSKEQANIPEKWTVETA